MYRMILFLAFFAGCSIVDNKDAEAVVGTWNITEQRASGATMVIVESTLVLANDGRYTFAEIQAGAVRAESQGTYRLGSLSPRQVIAFFNNEGTEPVPQMYFFVDDDTDNLVTSVHPNFTLPRRWTRQ
ncbi:MAG: hypothetical protein ACRCY4_10840 [Brevinema sp.]